MAYRSIWKGSLGFGLVNIPVKVFTATEDKRKEVALHQYHQECGSRVQMPKYCPKCNKHLQTEDIVKGYPLDEKTGVFVPLTKEELESLPLESAKSIQVRAFIKGDLTDPRYLSDGDAYFLSPEESGARAFVLFERAMKDMGVVGLAKFAVRDREKVAIIRSFNGVLLLQTIHWADELRGYEDLTATGNISPKEMELAKTLIGSITTTEPIDKLLSGPEYADTYREAMGKLIQAKAEGKTISTLPATPKATGDLVDALMASLKAMEISERTEVEPWRR